jgi:hypothetical protein
MRLKQINVFTLSLLAIIAVAFSKGSEHKRAVAQRYLSNSPLRPDLFAFIKV